jgi:hypothetical protein
MLGKTNAKGPFRPERPWIRFSVNGGMGSNVKGVHQR